MRCGLTKQRHEHRRFSGAGRSNNQVDSTTLESHLVLDTQRKVTATASWGQRAVVVLAPGKGRLANANDLRINIDGREDRLGLCFSEGVAVLIEEFCLGKELGDTVQGDLGYTIF